jgi:hypothetical protein
MRLVSVCIISIIFWAFVAGVAGWKEPWDMTGFWMIAYPAGLVLSMLMGALLKNRQWLGGPIVMFAQIPVVLAVTEGSALLIAGIAYATILSIPALALSWFAGRLQRSRIRR